MSAKTAIRSLLGLLILTLLFHLCILFKIIPYEISWGGRLKNDTEMYVFESISIVVNLLLYLILLIKGKYLPWSISDKLITFVLWIFLCLFSLNTIGNLVAKTNFEKSFALLTLAFVILIAIILRKQPKTKSM